MRQEPPNLPSKGEEGRGVEEGVDIGVISALWGVGEAYMR